MNRSIKLKTALVAVGGSLAAVPAAGIELGDVKVHSALGQPLRASIAYALAPHEAIFDTCVSLMSGPAAPGMPSISQASMIVSDGVIAITGGSIVREPLVSMRVSIRCPYTPRLTREYMLFVDPADPAPMPASAPATVTPADMPAVAALPEPAAATSARRPSTASTRLPVATRYRVQPGDTLSEIAERIEDRPVALWPAVHAIFAANPAAFIGGDMNRLVAGAVLDIPDFGSAAALSVVEPEPAAVADTASGTATGPGRPAPVVQETTGFEPAADAAMSAATGEPSAERRPGNVILDTEHPGVAPAGKVDVVIIDAALDGPAAGSSNPNVPTAAIRTAPATDEQGSSLLWWIIGGGLAILAALLLFGRAGSRLGSKPIGAASSAPQRRRDDAGGNQRLEAIGAPHVQIDDDSPTAENLALDTDLVIGAGLMESDDAEVGADFAFAATTELDLELPEEMSSGGGAAPADTDIIPPLNIDPYSILEEEVLPEDDEYDMSVIVDATKTPDPAEVTERDLEAIAVADNDEELITGNYTVSQEADYTILEQDYEDELTATQALNAEIQKAAEELASRMTEVDAEEETKEITLATVHELDVTARLRGRNDAAIDAADNSGIDPAVELKADEKTVEMPKDGKRAG